MISFVHAFSQQMYFIKATYSPGSSYSDTTPSGDGHKDITRGQMDKGLDIISLFVVPSGSEQILPINALILEDTSLTRK